MDEVGFNRRSFLWRTGSLGAAATVPIYPSNASAAVPLSLLIALMLNFLATEVNPASIAGPIATSPFANLSFNDKAKAFEALEGANSNLLATLDANAPEPMKASLSGLLKFVGGALQ